jgi:predicted esterase
LEALGGFHCLPIENGANFHSPLGTDGFVKWSIVDDACIEDADKDGYSASTRLNFAFPGVDWAFHQSVYGWAGLQYQAFARGFIHVSGQSSCRVAISADNILEFAINDKPFFGGNFYGFGPAPLILDLSPGENKIDLRLIRDVRAMGAGEGPSISVRLSAQICMDFVKVVENSALVPDVVNGKLASPYGSVIVRNECDNWISVIGIQTRNVSFRASMLTIKVLTVEKDSPSIRLLRSSPIRLTPGQTRPISFRFGSLIHDALECTSVAFVCVAEDGLKQVTAFFKLHFCESLIGNAHKFTFLHTSGTVSYAILRPPKSKAIEFPFPVLLNLHGAGLEADSPQVRHMLDAAPDLNAWVLLPTGMSPWSGDDWHVWGFADVKAAVSAIPNWILNMNWTGPRVDIERWLVTGHSNGGQGSWFIASHQPDKVMAVAAASGYSSIQNYVPYTMWREADPLIDSIVQTSLNSYRHELLVENLKGMPIYQQHGAKDNNVPPYHSRLLSTLLNESGSPSQYVELPKQGHWFEGAMTTKPFRAFYSAMLDHEFPRKQVPQFFEFIVPNSDDTGSRAGIFVDQLQSPDIFGRFSVHRNDETGLWSISTSNVRRMSFSFRTPGVLKPIAIIVDGIEVQMPSKSGLVEELALVRSGDKWEVCDSRNWKILSARHGRQRGSLDAVLRTLSTFKIQMCSAGCFEAALQVSRNLIQYFGADAEIVNVDEIKQPEAAGLGNIITLGIGSAIPPSCLSNFPVQVGANGVQIRRPHLGVVKQITCQPGLGAAFLRPLPHENLELVLWACDEVGLQQAIRMVPTLTGAGQPDFVVLGNKARWQGHAGVLAMGFFDYAWQISQGSYVP